MAQSSRAQEQAESHDAAISIADVLNHPEFQKMLEEIEQAPPSQRAQIARRLASSAEFRKRGIPLPPGSGRKLKIRFFDPTTGQDLAGVEE